MYVNERLLYYLQSHMTIQLHTIYNNSDRWILSSLDYINENDQISTQILNFQR